MIRSKIQFGNSEVKDLFDEYSIVHLESGEPLHSPIKKFESTSYAEEGGEHIYPKTVPDAFDYKVELLVLSSHGQANAKIAAFNAAMSDTDADGVMTFKTISFYNAYRKIKITGIPNPLSDSKQYIRRKGEPDAVKATLTIRVYDPSLCDWNLESV